MLYRATLEKLVDEVGLGEVRQTFPDLAQPSIRLRSERVKCVVQST